MIKKFFISVLIIGMLLTPINVYAEENITTFEHEPEITIEYKQDEQETLDSTPKIGCKAAYVADPITGKVFFEKNAHEKMYPASTTKILTALLVLEKCNLTDKAIISKNALSLVPQGYSNAKLQEGEEFDIKTLLYALLVPSANEAANVLAEHVSGSIEAFAELCNNRAKELGCENLHFVNPNGLHNENHYCTAYDLYLIAKECKKHDIFNEIVKTTSFTVPPTKVHPKNDRTFKNTNSLLITSEKRYYYSYCTGIKTGHTTPAGNCLVGSSSHDNIDLISVVLGGETNSKGLNERFYDTKQLFEFVYSNYSYKEIADKGQVMSQINVEKATKDTAALDVIVNTKMSALAPNNLDLHNITTNIDMDDAIIAPIKQNQILGYVTFEVDGLNYTTELIASHEVKKLPYWLYNTLVLVTIFLVLLIVIITRKKHKNKKHKSSTISNYIY